MAEQTQTMENPPAQERMGLRSIGGHALIYGIGMLVNRAIGFVMLPVYTRYLTPADYGIVNLVEQTFDVLSIIAGARLAVGVYHFFHKAETEEQRRRVVTTAVLLTGLLALPVGLAAVLTAGSLSDLIFRTPDRASFFIVAGFSFVLQGFQIVPYAYLQLKNRSRLYVGIQLAKVLVQIVLNVTFLVGLGLGPIALLLSTLIANLVVDVVLIRVVWKDCGMGFDRTDARALVRYGAPLMLTQVATFFITFGDRFFLQYYKGEAAVGLYSMSYQFGFLLAMLAATPFQMIWNPIRFDIVKRDDRDEMHARAFLFFNVLLLAMGTGIGLFVTDALRLLTTPEFHSAANVVPIILLAYVFHSWLFQDVGILATEKTGYIALGNWVSAVLIGVGYVTLIPLWGALGAALSTLVALFVRWLMLYLISQRLLYLAYRWRPVITMLVTGSAIVAVRFLLPTMPILPSLATSALLFLVWVASIPLLRVLSREEIGDIVRWSTAMLEPVLRRWRRAEAT